MELKEYISETIKQIVIGITDAQDAVKGMDVIINPDKTIGNQGEFWVPQKDMMSLRIERRVQLIEMDILIGVSESETNSIGGKVGISVFGVGVNSEGLKGNTNQNRVKFSIPICLPVTKV
jgi:hypothetical protein